MVLSTALEVATSEPSAMHKDNIIRAILYAWTSESMSWQKSIQAQLKRGLEEPWVQTSGEECQQFPNRESLLSCFMKWTWMYNCKKTTNTFISSLCLGSHWPINYQFQVTGKLDLGRADSTGWRRPVTQHYSHNQKRHPGITGTTLLLSPKSYKWAEVF